MNLQYSKRRASTGLLTLCLGTAVALVAPAAALGADSGSGGTVRAILGADGAATAVKQVAANGVVSGFSGQLPIKLAITRTVSGATQTYTYHVENTFSQTQTVHYTDTNGVERHTSTTLQLPLVAQLGVDVPKSLSNLAATGATVTSDGATRHVLWDMVLFSPLGSSAQDFSFTASGRGTPVAQLRATPIDPSTAPGLSAKVQDKTAEFQQEDFWAGYAGGGNKGLTQLADGTSQMVAGLEQLFAGATELHSGLADGLSGTQQAAAGSTELYAGAKKAHAGAQQLTAGSAKVHKGQGDLTTGLKQIHAGIKGKAGDPASGLIPGLQAIHSGQHDLTAGLTKISQGLSDQPGGLTDGLSQIVAGITSTDPANPGLLAGLDQVLAGITGVAGDPTSGLIPGLTAIHDGQTDLTSGLTTIHDGQATLTGGIGQIAGGLGQLTDPATGLPAAIVGVQQLQAGVTQLLAGVGDDATNGTLLNGVTQVKGGLEVLLDGLTNPTTGAIAGLTCAKDITHSAITGADAGTVAGDPCFQAFGLTQPVTAAPDAGTVAALTVAETIVGTVLTGMQTQGVPGIQAMIAGVDQIHAGLSSGDPANPGVKEGLQQLGAGLTQLEAGLNAASAGATALEAGANTALAGSQALTDGSATALAGSQQLETGSAGALAGAQQLQGGVQLIQDGTENKLLPGVQAAHDGSALLYAGSQDALSGSQQLTDGSFAALKGARLLLDGTGKALSGSQQLFEGTGNGPKQLTGGLRSLTGGLGQISGGLGQLSSGLVAGAKTFPQAVDGAGQVADGVGQVLDGAKQVNDGIGQVQSGATKPLVQQLTQASRNAHQQIAVLAAAGGLSAQTPGGAGTSYILSQPGASNGFVLTASKSSSSGGSHTARNTALIALGGIIALAIGVGVGVAMGRQRVSA